MVSDTDQRLQSKIFVSGSVMSPAIQWGFLAEDKSLPGVIWYLIQISGFFVVGLMVLVFRLGRRERTMLLSFLFPMFFAFFMSLTPDINVNHKYIMISWAGSCISAWKAGAHHAFKLSVSDVFCLFYVTYSGYKCKS